MPSDEQLKELQDLREDLFDQKSALEKLLREFGLPDDAKALVLEVMDQSYVLGKMKANIDKHMAQYPLPDPKNTMWRVIFENSIGVGSTAGELEEKDWSVKGQPHYAKSIFLEVREDIAKDKYTQKPMSDVPEQPIDDDYYHELGSGD